MYKLYHAIWNPKDKDLFSKMLTGHFTWPQEYEFVALVPSASSLEEVWQYTNSIYMPWYKGAGVQPVSDDKSYRSTSVGDVIESPDGSLHRVVGLGFEDIINPGELPISPKH